MPCGPRLLRVIRARYGSSTLLLHPPCRACTITRLWMYHESYAAGEYFPLARGAPGGSGPRQPSASERWGVRGEGGAYTAQHAGQARQSPPLPSPSKSPPTKVTPCGDSNATRVTEQGHHRHHHRLTEKKQQHKPESSRVRSHASGRKTGYITYRQRGGKLNEVLQHSSNAPNFASRQKLDLLESSVQPRTLRLTGHGGKLSEI